jgi:hypothetical protein
MAVTFERIANEFEQGSLPEFTPGYFYEPKTDSLQFYLQDTPSYGNRLNELFTIFVADEDDSLVGFEIKGVSSLIDRVGSFGLEVTNETVKPIPMRDLVKYAVAPVPIDPDAVGWLASEAEKWAGYEVNRADLQPS